MRINLNDRVILTKAPAKDGEPWLPPTSGGGRYVVTAVNIDGRFQVDGVDTWISPDRVSEARLADE